jgi:hypothetical protein
MWLQWKLLGVLLLGPAPLRTASRGRRGIWPWLGDGMGGRKGKIGGGGTAPFKFSLLALYKSIMIFTPMYSIFFRYEQTSASTHTANIGQLQTPHNKSSPRSDRKC